jgi:serine/threonine-protein kinase
MPIDTPSLIATLLEHHLLDGAAENVLPELSLTCPGATDLVAELVRRRWLTHFQAELLLAGRASEMVVGQYVLLERLGQGGMGTVYKAQHRVLKAVRALKIIHPERLTGPNAVKRFFQEVEAVGKLFHPNIILPHDAGVTGGAYFLAMEYVPGADLGRLLDRGGPLPPADAAEFIRQGALAMQHAHERGLVHRDIKPANLLVSSADGRVKLLDLGLARVRALEEEGAGPQTALTQAGAMMGTPDYMAPEQAVDSHSVDIRADIYALGCTLYHVLAGRPPFPGGSVMDKLIKHRTQEAQPLESLRKDLPPGLSAVVRKAMAKSAAERHQTPDELASALAPFCSGVSPEKPRPAGASGEHPIFPRMTRPSLATVAEISSRNRVPTPPGRRTVTAPAGAMPGPSDRTVASIETQLAENIPPPQTIAATRPTRRRTHWPAMLAMVAAGVVIAAGARYFQTRNHDDSEVVVSPQTAASLLPPPSSAPAVSAVPLAAHSNSTDSTPLPPPEKLRLAEAKLAGRGVRGAAAGRLLAGDPAAGIARTASFVRRETLYRLHAEQVSAIAFSAGGGRAAVVSDEHLDVYDLASRGAKLPVALEQLSPGLSDSARTPTAVAVSADGRNAYLTTTAPIGGEGNNKSDLVNAVIHWEYQQTPVVLLGPPIDAGSNGKPEYLCVAVAPDGGVLAAGALRSGAASWWNGAVKPPERRDFKHLVGDAVSALAFSADGKRVLFCGRDRDLCLHTLGLLGGAPPLPMKGHPKGARCAAFSADGRFAVSGGRDGKVCVWDFTGPPPADGILRPAKELIWHEGEVKAVAFAPAGDRFVTGGEDGYFCLGEVGRSDRIFRERLDVRPARVRAVAFSGDGNYALYATDQSIGRFFPGPPPLAEIRHFGGGTSAVAKPSTVH